MAVLQDGRASRCALFHSPEVLLLRRANERHDPFHFILCVDCGGFLDFFTNALGCRMNGPFQDHQPSWHRIRNAILGRHLYVFEADLPFEIWVLVNIGLNERAGLACVIWCEVLEKLTALWSEQLV